MEAPIYAGVTVGEGTFYLDGKLLACSELKTRSDVYIKDYRYYIDLVFKNG